MADAIREGDYSYTFGSGNNIPSVEFVTSNLSSNPTNTNFSAELGYNNYPNDAVYAGKWKYADKLFDYNDIQLLNDISVRYWINKGVDKIAKIYHASRLWSAIKRVEEVADALKDFWKAPLSFVENQISNFSVDNNSPPDFNIIDRNIDDIFEKGEKFKEVARKFIEDAFKKEKVSISSHEENILSIDKQTHSDLLHNLVNPNVALSETLISKIDSFSFVAKTHYKTTTEGGYFISDGLGGGSYVPEHEVTRVSGVNFSYDLGGHNSVLNSNDKNFVFDSNNAGKYTGGNKDDVFVMRGGSDVVVGGNGNDYINGGSGADRLNGGDGIDLLIGGSGRDVLKGGNDLDIFVFKKVTDSKVSVTDCDIIQDFTSNDFIDLSFIDANSKISGNQSFTFLENRNFTGHAGELNAKFYGSDTLMRGDVNGDGVADFSILVRGHHTFDTSTLAV